MWDVPVITDQTILTNRPDIILHDKMEKTGVPIDIAAPDDSNVNIKEIRKTKQVQRPGDRRQAGCGK
jgi:hypothetical protein